MNPVYAINLADQTANPLAKYSSFSVILNVIIPLLMTVAALSFLFMLIYGAVTYLTSAGIPDKLKKAQQILFTSIIGLIIIVCAYLFTRLIGYIFNVAIPI